MLASDERTGPVVGDDARALPGRLSTLARALGWTDPPLVGLFLVLLTATACILRAFGTTDAPGTLARDESRLALAAQGILQHGFPLMPGGIVYTRGLLPAYVEAGAFWLFGVTDATARLPALVAGTLLIPAVYGAGRAFMRPWPALGAAAITACSLPLVTLAREGWLYSWLSLWIVLCLGYLVRAQRDPSLEPRILAGLTFAAAVFSHELAIVVLPAILVYEASNWRRGLRQESAPWPFWCLVLVSSGLVLGLTANLRASTSAGPGAEFASYLGATVGGPGLTASLRLVAAAHPWLAPLGALGLAVMILRGRVRHPVWLFILGCLAALTFNGFVLNRRGHPRDIQVLLPLLAISASFVAWSLAPHVITAFRSQHHGHRTIRLLGAACGAWLVVSGVDVPGLGRLLTPAPVTPTWLQEVEGIQSTDLVLSFAPTETTHYLGRTDFWLRPNDFSRYVWAGSTPPRDIYTGAAVVRNIRDVETLVLRPNQGKTLWVLAQREPPSNQRAAIEQILTGLLARGAQERPTGDGTRVVRLRI